MLKSRVPHVVHSGRNFADTVFIASLGGLLRSWLARAGWPTFQRTIIVLTWAVISISPLAAQSQDICDSRTACLNEADLERSLPLPNLDRLRLLLVMACDFEAEEACVEVAELMVEAGAAESAATLLRDSCNRRYGPACYDLGKLYENGLGVDRDLGIAERLFSSACDLGDCRRRDELAEREATERERAERERVARERAEREARERAERDQRETAERAELIRQLSAENCHPGQVWNSDQNQCTGAATACRDGYVAVHTRPAPNDDFGDRWRRRMGPNNWPVEGGCVSSALWTRFHEAASRLDTRSTVGFNILMWVPLPYAGLAVPVARADDVARDAAVGTLAQLATGFRRLRPLVEQVLAELRRVPLSMDVSQGTVVAVGPATELVTARVSGGGTSRRAASGVPGRMATYFMSPQPSLSLQVSGLEDRALTVNVIADRRVTMLMRYPNGRWRRTWSGWPKRIRRPRPGLYQVWVASTEGRQFPSTIRVSQSPL